VPAQNVKLVFKRLQRFRHGFVRGYDVFQAKHMTIRVRLEKHLQVGDVPSDVIQLHPRQGCDGGADDLFRFQAPWSVAGVVQA
jgi:hypothetical protein